MQVLDEMDYFHIYPSSDLKTRLRDSSTDGDRIRAILRDGAVQEYLFPDWRHEKSHIHDPIAHYVRLRKNGTIHPR